MRHLFTYGPVPVAEAEKVPLKETEIGPVPAHWEVVKLGNAVSFSVKPRNLEFEPYEKIPFYQWNIYRVSGLASINMR